MVLLIAVIAVCGILAVGMLKGWFGGSGGAGGADGSGSPVISGDVIGVGAGQVILVQVDGAGLVKVDGGIRNGSCAGRKSQAEENGDGHGECAEALEIGIH